MMEIRDELKRAAVCVHIAVEEPVAKDLSRILHAGCDEIDRLRVDLARLTAENEKLSRDLDFERSTNNFDATRLRRLATLVSASTPESDETLLGCAGTVICPICRQVEQTFKRNQKLRDTLKEVSGCHSNHGKAILCDGCLISIAEYCLGERGHLMTPYQSTRQRERRVPWVYK